MKFIHCADLHLDSPLKSKLKDEKISKRKEELLDTFLRLAQYAKENDVTAIIIAGDMFDNSKKIKVKTTKRVLEIIKQNSSVDFLYLKGNHDEDSFGDGYEIPDNLKFFDSTWEYYKYKNVVIAGAELGKNKNILNELELEFDTFNIVVLHGQIDKSQNPKDKEEVINLAKLKNQNIDYLALGHIHKSSEGKLDTRGIYAYSGCLEGRSFDECGTKGFIELEIDEQNNFSHKFVPFAKRTIHEVEIDVSEIESDLILLKTISSKIEDIPHSDILRIVLTGTIVVDNESEGLETLLNIEEIVRKYEDDYFYFEVKDSTKTVINYEKFEHDISLKGEFIRLVNNEISLSDEQKEAICKLGIKTIFGGDI